MVAGGRRATARRPRGPRPTNAREKRQRSRLRKATLVRKFSFVNIIKFVSNRPKQDEYQEKRINSHLWKVSLTGLTEVYFLFSIRYM